MSAAPMMPTLEQAMAAQFLRRDIDPPGETRVAVRVRTCATGFVFAGYTLDVRDEDLEVDDTIPLRFAWVELQMFPSHARALLAELRRRRATAEDIGAAVRNLWSDLVQLEAVDATDADGNERAPVVAEIVRAFDAGEVKGRTDRPYRPSFPASFRNVTGRDFYPVVAIEAPDGLDLDDAPAVPSRRSKRAA